jgi:hypothetical protein
MICKNPCRRASAYTWSACVFPKSVFAEQRQRPSNRREFFRLLFLVLAFSLFPSTARSQTTATLSGTVQDLSTGVIPGAQVTLINEASGDTRLVQSNGTGLYVFPSLVPGFYTLKATAKGFSSKAITGIELHAGDERTVPAFTLGVGAATQTVTVAAGQVAGIAECPVLLVQAKKFGLTVTRIGRH